MGTLSSFCVLLPCASLGLLTLSGCGGSGSSGDAPESLVGSNLVVTNTFPDWTPEQQIAYGNLYVAGFNVIPSSVNTCQFLAGGTAFADPHYASTYAYYRKSDNTATLQLAYNAKRAQTTGYSFNLRYNYNLTFDADKTATGDCTVTITPTQINDIERLTLSGTTKITGFPR